MHQSLISSLAVITLAFACSRTDAESSPAAASVAAATNAEAALTGNVASNAAATATAGAVGSAGMDTLAAAAAPPSSPALQPSVSPPSPTAANDAAGPGSSVPGPDELSPGQQKARALLPTTPGPYRTPQRTALFTGDEYVIVVPAGTLIDVTSVRPARVIQLKGKPSELGPSATVRVKGPNSGRMIPARLEEASFGPVEAGCRGKDVATADDTCERPCSMGNPTDCEGTCEGCGCVGEARLPSGKQIKVCTFSNLFLDDETVVKRERELFDDMQDNLPTEPESPRDQRADSEPRETPKRDKPRRTLPEREPPGQLTACCRALRKSGAKAEGLDKGRLLNAAAACDAANAAGGRSGFVGSLSSFIPGQKLPGACR